jgi:hypothetical protein
MIIPSFPAYCTGYFGKRKGLRGMIRPGQGGSGTEAENGPGKFSSCNERDNLIEYSHMFTNKQKE